MVKDTQLEWREIYVNICFDLCGFLVFEENRSFFIVASRVMVTFHSLIYLHFPPFRP